MGAKAKVGGTPYHGTRLVQVGLLPPQRTWLEEQASERGCSLTQVLRDLIDQAMKPSA